MTTIEQLRTTVQQQQQRQEQQRRRQWVEVCHRWEQCCHAERRAPPGAAGAFSPDNPYLAALEATRMAYLQLPA